MTKWILGVLSLAWAVLPVHAHGYGVGSAAFSVHGYGCGVGATLYTLGTPFVPLTYVQAAPLVAYVQPTATVASLAVPCTTCNAQTQTLADPGVTYATTDVTTLAVQYPFFATFVRSYGYGNTFFERGFYNNNFRTRGFGGYTHGGGNNTLSVRGRGGLGRGAGVNVNVNARGFSRGGNASFNARGFRGGFPGARGSSVSVRVRR